MTVSSIIRVVRSGELKQLGVGKNLRSTDPEIVKEAEEDILSYINLGLIELYKRFNLKTEETSVQMVENQVLYPLTPINLNFVLAAYDELGDEFPLNDEYAPSSVLTPSYNTIQMTAPVIGSWVFIVYNSAPDEVLWNVDLATVEVILPPAMLEALAHYIGYRAHGALDGNVDAENNTHYMRFEKSCQTLINLGYTANDGLVAGTKLEDKGFA